MAINFPNNPLDGNTYTYEGVKYTFKDTGSGGYWYLKDLGTATAATTADVNAGTDNTKYVTSDSLSGSTYDTRITSNANGITSLSNSKANTSGTYSGLRAQATTKADVGLGNIPNATSNSTTSNSTSTLATSYAVNQVRRYLPKDLAHGSTGQLTWARTTTIGGTITAGVSYSGSSLRPYGVSISGNNAQESWVFGGVANGVPLSGTWRALGHIQARWDRYPATLFVRTS